MTLPKLFQPFHLKSVMQGKVEVKYFTNDKLFPPGFQPACALKDGFLILTTSPDAVLAFRAGAAPGEEAKESTLVHISAQELAKLLEQRREHILSSAMRLR